MAKATTTNGDQRLKAFFKSTLQSEPGIGGELAERMAERCVESIDRILTQSGQSPSNGGEILGAVKTSAAGFDPFAFSAVAVLAKHGREALLARLSEIREPDHLRQLANAQHIAVDPALVLADDLRVAIVRGVERRIASRRAAAS